MELRHPRAPALIAACRVALLAGPTALAFFSGGYFEGPRLVAAIAAWALVAVLAVTVAGLPPSGAALLAVGGLAALLAWTAISRAWAPLAGPAGEEVQRDALYLAALAAGGLAWRSRRWAGVVEPALALGTLIVVGYGLAGRLLPGIVEVHRSISAGGRLDQPLTYWNAMGALAALGIVLCARIAGDGWRPRPLRIAAAAGAVSLATGLYLTYSRGAIGAMVCGLLVLLLLAPTFAQLRAIAIAVEAGAIGAGIAAALDGVASLDGTLAHRERDGAIVLAALVVLAAAAAALQAHGCRVERAGRIRVGPLPVPRWLRVAGVVVTVGVAAFPYAAALTERGTNAEPAFGANAARLGSVGSHRYAYWRVAARAFADAPLGGQGAGSFRVEWLRERPFPESVRDAHSLYVQTAAELGIVGLAALAALFAGVILALRRAWLADPALLTGPAAALAAWAVHAGVDWDWQMPTLTLVAVTLAGLALSRAPRRPRRSAVERGRSRAADLR